jgi:hypothetical protein
VRLQENSHVRPLTLQIRQNLTRSVRGSIVDAQQLDVQADREDAVNHAPNRGLLVVYRITTESFIPSPLL